MTEKQRRTKERIAFLREQQRSHRVRLDNYEDQVFKEIAELQELIDAEETNCDHVDEGGMFVAVCKICGHCEW